MNFAEIFLKLVVLLAAEKDEITDDPNVTNSLLCPSEIAGKKHEQKIPYTIYIEGNVGCGKSTFLELFRGDPNIQIVQEPVAEWQNVSGNMRPNMLVLVKVNQCSFDKRAAVLDFVEGERGENIYQRTQIRKIYLASTKHYPQSSLFNVLMGASSPITSLVETLGRSTVMYLSR
jgi:hypothetical protein